MSKSSTKRAALSLRLTAARKASLASVSRAAFASGVAGVAVSEAVREACGPKPILTLYKAVRDAFITARMAAVLPSQASETMEQRIAAADKLINKYQGHGGKAKLRDGMLGRRSKEQELAYGAARVAWTGVCKSAGVAAPTSQGGGDTSKTRRSANTKPKAAANNNKPLTVAQLSPKVKTGADAVRHIETQAKALAAFVTKNAKLDIPAEYGRAVVAFHKAIFKSVND